MYILCENDTDIPSISISWSDLIVNYKWLTIVRPEDGSHSFRIPYESHETSSISLSIKSSWIDLPLPWLTYN